MKLTNQITAFLAIVVLSMAVHNLQAQGKYTLEKTEIVFNSKTPVETIRAVNNNAQGIIATGKNKFLVRVPIQAFKFKRRLQQTHFNENYLESNKYPNATYRGTIEGNYSLSKDGVYKVTTKGDLTIHGVKKARTVPATITVKNGVATLNTSFKVKPKEHGVKIPKVVTEKIAEEIGVSIKAEFQKR